MMAGCAAARKIHDSRMIPGPIRPPMTNVIVHGGASGLDYDNCHNRWWDVMTHPVPVIGQAGVADAGSLRAIPRRCSAGTVRDWMRCGTPVPALAAHLAPVAAGPGALVLVGQRGTETAGCLEVVPSGDVCGQVAVLTEGRWRRQEIGRALVTIARQRAGQAGHRLAVSIDPGDPPAVKLAPLAGRPPREAGL
jgi:GNAT superfamily N-acetyltransferase